jgi:hypothetical protein
MTHVKVDGGSPAAVPCALVVALAALVAFACAGCGHSEEEWQAMLDKQKMLQERCQPGAGQEPAAVAPSLNPTAPGCGKDVDCKGDRVCNLGRCVSPR